MWRRLSVDEFLARAAAHGHEFSPRVEARLRKLNPNGIHEGSYPRGWHPHHRFSPLEYDVVPVREFVRRFGSKVYHALPRFAFLRSGHRKAIRRAYVQDFLPA